MNTLDAGTRGRTCSDVIRRHSRTFYRSTQLLGPKRRRAIHAVYAFCRCADDLVDLAPQPHHATVAAALDDWLAQIDRPVDPVAIEFAEARRAFAIDAQPARDLIRGLRMDLMPRRYETWSELREYCYLVAGTVGLLSAPVLGCRDERALSHAVDLGIAMQLTNILRDVAEDAARGRLYLPSEELAYYGCNEAAIAERQMSEPLAALIAFQIERARWYFASGARGLPALCVPGRLATSAAMHLYAEILGEIERRGYDVMAGRAVVPAARKARLTAPIVRSLLVPARQERGPERAGAPVWTLRNERDSGAHVDAEINSSAMMAEQRTPGSPAPGCVPAPTK